MKYRLYKFSFLAYFFTTADITFRALDIYVYFIYFILDKY